MEWIVIIAPILERLVQNCMNRQRGDGPKGRRRKRLGNVLIRKAVREARVPFAERAGVIEDLQGELAAMSESQVDEVCTDCCQGGEGLMGHFE